MPDRRLHNTGRCSFVYSSYDRTTFGGRQLIVSHLIYENAASFIEIFCTIIVYEPIIIYTMKR